MKNLKWLFIGLILQCFHQAYAQDLAITLSWKAPTHYGNGEKLYAKRDLKEYRLYFGKSQDHVRDYHVIIEPRKLTKNIPIKTLKTLKTPIVYFAMTSVSKDGLESELSETVFFLP